MRFMMIMIPKGYEKAEPGAMPDAKAVAAMMKYNESLQKAGVLLALVCWAANHWWLDAWERLRFLEKLSALLVAIVVSSITFFSVAFLLRVSEVQDVVDLATQRFRNRPL